MEQHQDLEPQLQQLAATLRQNKRATVLSGAGISVDSGIPDFRSPGGLWERYNPMEYATIQAFLANPGRVWRMIFELCELLTQAKPNAGHLALTQLEQMGILDGIITQNIDSLHQRSGSKNVVELHGSNRRLRCLHCDYSSESPGQIPKDPQPPQCPRCHQVLKPDIVFFGEMLPADALAAATTLAESCAVMLVVGTSATVAPGSFFPVLAKQHGALLVEVNLAPTEISGQCDLVFHQSATLLLPRLVQILTSH